MTKGYMTQDLTKCLQSANQIPTPIESNASIAATSTHTQTRKGNSVTTDDRKGFRQYAIGVFGASGTTGTELCHILEQHPCCSIAFATSESYAGKMLRDVDPAAASIPLIKSADAPFEDVDLVFTCLPHGTSAAIVERCVAAGVKTIDLSGDLRLRDRTIHKEVYGSERPEALLEQVTFGITECSRTELSEAHLISNPGCYPTCAALGLYPLAREGCLPSVVTVDAKSGISGAGRKATQTTHYCSVADDVKPYAQGREHRHTYEIEQLLASFLPDGIDTPTVIFCPHVVPLERGMLATMVLEVTAYTAHEVHELYQQAYAEESFIEVLPLGSAARIRAVQRTNQVQIGIAPVRDTNHVVITSALDNVLKGASGQALQSMNVMLGLPEACGLKPLSLEEISSIANTLHINN